jgi:hypothetical protein
MPDALRREENPTVRVHLRESCSGFDGILNLVLLTRIHLRNNNDKPTGNDALEADRIVCM